MLFRVLALLVGTVVLVLAGVGAFGLGRVLVVGQVLSPPLTTTQRAALAVLAEPPRQPGATLVALPEPDAPEAAPPVLRFAPMPTAFGRALGPTLVAQARGEAGDRPEVAAPVPAGARWLLLTVTCESGGGVRVATSYSIGGGDALGEFEGVGCSVVGTPEAPSYLALTTLVPVPLGAAELRLSASILGTAPPLTHQASIVAAFRD